MLKRLLILIISLSLSSLALAAEEIKGTLEKIDGAFYVVKDAQGKTHRIHFDSSTKKKGDIKPGAQVDAYVENGHMVEITAEK